MVYSASVDGGKKKVHLNELVRMKLNWRPLKINLNYSSKQLPCCSITLVQMLKFILILSE